MLQPEHHQDRLIQHYLSTTSPGNNVPSILSQLGKISQQSTLLHRCQTRASRTRMPNCLPFFIRRWTRRPRCGQERPV